MIQLNLIQRKRNAVVVAIALFVFGVFFSPCEAQLAPASQPLSVFQWALFPTSENIRFLLGPQESLFFQRLPSENIKPLEFHANRKVLVGLIDTGVWTSHPNLKNIIARKPDECAALAKFHECISAAQGNQKAKDQCEAAWFDLNNPLVDKDKNGYPLDCEGWSFLTTTGTESFRQTQIVGGPEINISFGHGTHLAGIIGAEKNGSGLQGVSQNVLILPIQVPQGPREPLRPLSVDLKSDDVVLPKPIESVLKLPGGDFTTLVARSVLYALYSKVEVINLSMGWPGSFETPKIRALFEWAKKKQVFVVAAAGNDSTEELPSPCQYDFVICVGSHNPDGSISHYSNYGTAVDILAPGFSILSTWHEEIADLLLPKGYAYLSGTSQATGFVTGAIAEMLARGIRKNEIYPRLLAGARKTPKSLPLLAGVYGQSLIESLNQSQKPYEKKILSGNLDLQASIRAQPQVLIGLSTKSKKVLNWNLKDRKVTWSLELKNLWQDLDLSTLDLAVQLTAEMQREPLRIEQVRIFPQVGILKQNELLKIDVDLLFTDVDQAISRVSGDLQLQISPNVRGQDLAQLYPRAEIIVNIDNYFGLDSRWVRKVVLPNFDLSNVIRTPISIQADGRSADDLFLISDLGNQLKITLLRDLDQGGATAANTATIEVSKNLNRLRLFQYTARFWNPQQKRTEFVLGLFDDQSRVKKPSNAYFFVFDEKMNIVDQWSYDSKSAQISYVVKWMSWPDGKRRPVWVSQGKDPRREIFQSDVQKDRTLKETPVTSLYYLDSENQLQRISQWNKYFVIDVLEPSRSESLAGEVPVLLMKPKQNDGHKTGLNDFARAIFNRGEISGLVVLNQDGPSSLAADLLQTRINGVINLDYEDELFIGNTWFSQVVPRERQLTVFDHRTKKFETFDLSALANPLDAVKTVKSAFSGSDQKSTFTLTNSEVQFHDLMDGSVRSASFNRFTFMTMYLQQDFFVEILVDDANAGKKIPGLFFPEGLDWYKSLRVYIPHYENGKLSHLKIPAKFKIKSLKMDPQFPYKCFPVDEPRLGGKNYASSMGYICQSGQETFFLGLRLEY